MHFHLRHIAKNIIVSYFATYPMAAVWIFPWGSQLPE